MNDRMKEEYLATYEAHADAIYRHCYFRVFSKARAEELVQETFMRVWEYMTSGRKVDNVRALLYRIATNLIIDDSRKKKEGSLENLLEDGAMQEPASRDHIAMEARVLLGEVTETMQALTHEHREVLTLRYVNDLDPKEIAEILGESPNTVSVRLNRATNALRELLEESPEQ